MIGPTRRPAETFGSVSAARASPFRASSAVECMNSVLTLSFTFTLGRRRLAQPSRRRAGRAVGSDGPGIGRVLLGAPDAVRRAEEGRVKVLLLDREEELVDGRGVLARGLSGSDREGASRLR